MDKAFAAVFDDSKVEEVSRAAQEARVATDDKPDLAEEVEVEESAEPSSAKVDEAPPVTEEVQEPQKTPETRIRTVPHEALHAEKERRKALEAELAELRKAQEKPKTSVLDDEDKAFNERLSEAVAPVRSQFFELTVELAREKPGREDYDEIFEFMEAECKAHPELVTQIVSSKNPGETVYRLGKSRKELAAVGGDVSKLREHIEGEVLEKLTTAQARIKALETELEQARNSKKQREAIPQSLNSEQSASQKDEVFKGPTPLRDVLPKI